MSGLCGWIGHGTGAADNRVLIENMAAPLAAFDATPVRALQGARSAAAVAALGPSAHLYQNDGLTVALWGQPALAGAGPAQLGGDGLAEALAQAWRRDPDSVCASLSGAFSLCILDEPRGEALLAIDRMGTQQMSYQAAAGALVFASSADAIVRHPLTPAVIDPQGLYNYVYFHMVPGPGTVYRGQERLLPGEYLRFKDGRINKRAYWRMVFRERPEQDESQLKDQFRQILRNSVREASGGQQVGAFLSGGTDSSTIAGILCEVGGKPANTYSIGFEAEGYDEMSYARLASRHFGTSHHEYYVTPDDVVDAIPRIAAVFDQPFGNASAVPAFYCARMAGADGVTRMLGGDGGDELFGGNERYSKQHIFAMYEQVPGMLRKALLEPAVFNFPGGKNIKLIRKARSYIEQASVPMPARLETYNLLGRFGPSQVFTDDFLASADTDAPLASLAHTYAQSDASSLINRMLALDLKITLADNDLPKVVKACELAAMEVAFPFLSDEMVAFSSRLTARQKLNGTQLRWFFKEALRGFLPDQIITKQKHGFGLPFGVWLQKHKPLQELALDSLTGLKARRIVRPEFIDALVGQHLEEHAGYHGTMVWVLMMMEQWFRQREAQRG
ncbi:asparagine synthetase B family protein [Massilia cavernae]|uniref:asparagine synthase (glutamine-hydrolyzing) n=1 Tax=Massilia cavernae TaxID=2320864 RepID=A0A418XU87_9BURK|nr:asparagine synthase-related protein [Massilia cavernae]RJG16271.1 asparagine synthase [Massilia cavernae]